MGGGGREESATTSQTCKTCRNNRAEQGRNRESRHRTWQSPLPAKDDVLVVLVSSTTLSTSCSAFCSSISCELFQTRPRSSFTVCPLIRRSFYQLSVRG